MQPTLLGLILIPIGLATFWFVEKEKLLYALVFFAPFSAAAVVNIPAISSGVQPGYFIGLLLIARSLLEYIVRGRWTMPRPQLKGVLPFWLFGLVAFLSVIAVPLYGSVPVSRPSGEVELLRFSRQHISQLMYVAYVIVLLTTIGFMNLTREQVRRVLYVILLSGLFVAAWGWFQVVSKLVGMPYPAFLFNNSLSFSQAYKVTFLGLQRVSSVTPEPSMFARFMLIPTFISYYCVHRAGYLMPRRRAVMLAFFFSISLLASTSTTAYAGLLIGLVPFLYIVLRENERSLLSPWGMAQGLKIAGAVVGLLAVVLVGAFAATKWLFGLDPEATATFISVMITDKLETTSGQVRTEGALNGLKLFASHPLLGVGWGSNRTFDLFTHVLANTGLAGALLFFSGHIAVGLRTLRSTRRLRRRGERALSADLTALLIGLVVMLLGKGLAEPDIVYLDQWILLGVLIAAHPLVLRTVQAREHVGTQVA